jgi:hypothetical protein
VRPSDQLSVRHGPTSARHRFFQAVHGEGSYEPGDHGELHHEPIPSLIWFEVRVWEAPILMAINFADLMTANEAKRAFPSFSTFMIGKSSLDVIRKRLHLRGYGGGLSIGSD